MVWLHMGSSKSMLVYVLQSLLRSMVLIYPLLTALLLHSRCSTRGMREQKELVPSTENSQESLGWREISKTHSDLTTLSTFFDDRTAKHTTVRVPTVMHPTAENL